VPVDAGLVLKDDGWYPIYGFTTSVGSNFFRCAMVNSPIAGEREGQRRSLDTDLNKKSDVHIRRRNAKKIGVWNY